MLRLNPAWISLAFREGSLHVEANHREPDPVGLCRLCETLRWSCSDSDGDTEAGDFIPSERRCFLVMPCNQFRLCSLLQARPLSSAVRRGHYFAATARFQSRNGHRCPDVAIRISRLG